MIVRRHLVPWALGAVLIAATPGLPAAPTASASAPDAAAASGAAAAAPALALHPAPFIALSVADLERQQRWYRDTLGFTVTAHGTMPHNGIRYLLLRDGAALIELLQVPGARARAAIAPELRDAAQLHGFFKSGMVVADVAGLQRRLQARGADIAFALVRPPNGPYRVFGVRDPEGNLLQFFGE